MFNPAHLQQWYLLLYTCVHWTLLQDASERAGGRDGRKPDRRQSLATSGSATANQKQKLKWNCSLRHTTARKQSSPAHPSVPQIQPCFLLKTISRDKRNARSVFTTAVTGHNSSNFRRSLQGHLHWRTQGALGNTHFNSVWHVHWNICSGFPHSEHGKTRVNNLTSEMNYGMNESQVKEYLQTGGGRAEGKSTQVPCWCQKSQFEISLPFHIFSTKMCRKRKHFHFFFSFRNTGCPLISIMSFSIFLAPHS